MPGPLLRLAARSTLRHRARTVFTAGMVALSVALLIIALSWVRGVFGQMLRDATTMAGHVRVVTWEYAAREQLAPLHENLPEVDSLLARLRRTPGVISVYPRITTGVTVTVGEEIGDIFALVVGAPDGYFRDRLKAPQNLEQGRWFEGEGELVMGFRVARQVGARLGDEVVMIGLTQDGALSPIKGILTGIVSGGNSFLDRQIFLPLEQVQWLTDIPGGAIEILVFGERYRDAAVLARSLRGVPELGGLAVQAWSERDPYAGMMAILTTVQGIIIFFIVLLAALGILNSMMMSVLERTSEIGALRAMGLGRMATVGLFLSEALVIAVVGGGMGILLGYGPAKWLELRGVRLGEDVAASLSTELPLTTTVYGELTAGIVIGALLLGLLAAILGSVLPAIRASGIQPVVAMRTRR